MNEHPDIPPLLALLEGLGSRDGEPSRDDLLSAFLEYVAGLGIELYPAQEEAILELLDWKHVILSTPTGSGKSLVAQALHFQAMAEDRVSYYTAPTKALVNEKFFDLCDAFGPNNVGLLTGDAAVNREAPLVCCTAEVLANMALCEDDLDIGYVVMDEFHYYGDRDRGSAWQIPLITMRGTMFLLMSATLGDTTDIEQRLRDFTGREVAAVGGSTRPVPLKFEYKETVLHETIEELVRTGEAPVYLVNFTQRACAEQAQNLMSINVTSKEEKQAIGRELEGVAFDTPYGKEFQRFVRHGIGVHHAGLLPRYRRVVERLAQQGLVKVISGTDTLGVGVNIPIRTVVLSRLYKFDGEKTGIITAREFHQIAGRAGRKGFDDHGNVVVQAPEWVIENKKIDAKIVKSPHLKKKLVKQKPPPHAVAWDDKIFARLEQARPEPLEPRFEVTHGMLINLLGSAGERPGGGYRRLRELIKRSHGTDAVKRLRKKRALELFRSLRRAGIVELVPRGNGRGAVARVRDDLQDDFSLNHSLSLYLVEALTMLDPQSETFALDALTLVESILEDPNAVLFRQVDLLKGDLVARLKAEGVPYEERMEELEKVEHPRPNAEFVYQSFNAFAEFHPWVGGESIRPKSVAREMFERMADFNDYVEHYGLHRSEGVLLRYVSQAYKTALQNVPETCWDETFEDVLAFLHGVVRRTDSSLLEEWETLMAGPVRGPEAREPARPVRPPSVADDPRAFKARVRSELHVLLGALSRRDFAAACALVHRTEQHEWTPEAFEEELGRYFEEHAAIDITPRARMAHNTAIREDGARVWICQQKIIDPEGDEDWGITCVVDLTEPRDETGPLIELVRIGV